jgi:hypothetical protein
MISTCYDVECLGGVLGQSGHSLGSLFYCFLDRDSELDDLESEEDELFLRFL